MSLKINDFQPINSWRIDKEGEKFTESDIDSEDSLLEDQESGSLEIPKYIIDETTGKKYLNESQCTIRRKCFGLAIGTPIAHIPCGLLNIGYRIDKFITGSFHWWTGIVDDSSDPLDPIADGCRIIAQPLAIIGLELSAIYGIINPYDGRKLYASIEKAEYGRPILAPCFQPNPEEHFFGGDINTRDQY